MDLFEKISRSLISDSIVQEVIIGIRTTMVAGSGAGLSSTFRSPACPASHEGLTDAGKLTGKPVQMLLEKYRHGDLTERSVAVAALNAMLDQESSDQYCTVNAFDIIRKKAAGRRIAVVGRFPFAEKLTSIASDVSIIQESPENGKKGVEQAEAIFPNVDVAAITGSALINGTLGRLLEIAEGRYVIVLGASTPMSAVLFQHGVDALCGTVVEDAARVRDYVLQGASFRHMNGIRRVTWFKDQKELENWSAICYS